ncbi:MAG: DUF2971 domain-containing protein [Chryseotalea sp.]|jgi:hypothetical protein
MAKLYHYTKATTLIEHILPNMQLRSGYLNDMNDPREKQPFAFGGKNIPLKEIFKGYYSDETHIDCLYRLGKDIKDRIQLFCFCGEKQQGWNNEMMWAHYANKHKGVCIELDEELLLNEIKASKLNYKLEGIDYSEKASKFIYWQDNMSLEENILHFINAQYRDLAFKKSKC